MLSKTFLALLLISVILMSSLTFLCYNWLQSIGNPVNVVENYRMYAGISWTTLWISFGVLVVFANILLWKDRSAWALWTSLLFFVTFIVVQTFWLDSSFFSFQKANNLTEKSFFLKPFLGAAISAVSALAIFLDQFMVLHLRDKIFEKKEPAGEISDPSEPESKDI